MVHVINGLSVAFKSVFLFLRGWRRVEILYGDLIFHRTGCVFGHSNNEAVVDVSEAYIPSGVPCELRCVFGDLESQKRSVRSHEPVIRLSRAETVLFQYNK